jgi:outer membrane protein TolC
VAGRPYEKNQKHRKGGIMKKFTYMILLILVIPGTLSAQKEVDPYLEMAAENNPGLRAKFNQYLASLEQVPQVRSLPDPQLAFGYFISPVETRVGPQQFRISASQMFPWFGTLKTREDAQIQTARANYEIFLEAKSRLFNEVRATYYNLYFNRRAMDITRENLTILESFQELANIRVEAGKASAVDEYRVEMEIGDLENHLAQLVDKQHVLEVMFFNLLNTDRDFDIIIPEVLWTDDMGLTRDQVLDSIRNRNHQLLTISLEREALEYREELARKTGKPDFTLGLDYTIVGQGENGLAGTDAFMFPRIGITIPLYRNKYKAMVNEAVFLQQAKEFEREEKINLLETMLERTWQEYLDADRRRDLYLTQQDLASKAMKLLETEYATGNKNFEEILRMERKLLVYGLELEKARSDKQAAISFINYLMGK